MKLSMKLYEEIVGALDKMVDEATKVNGEEADSKVSVTYTITPQNGCYAIVFNKDTLETKLIEASMKEEL